MNRRRFLSTAGAGVGAVSALGALGQFALGGREPIPATQTPTPESWSDNGITAAWLGHATVIINFYGVRVLTDPVLFPRIGVDLWFRSIGPMRLTACALPPSQLPEIDLVLLSHAHFDHLDTPSLAALRGRPTVITASRISDLVPRKRFAAVRELDWGGSARIHTARGEVDVTALEVKHWGARLGRDTYRGYNGYVIRREGRALLFGGDTAHTPLFASHRRYGPFEVALMPIGAYDPFIRNHCAPEQAVAMADAAGARLFVPIHHKSFQLGREAFAEPIERVEAALRHEADRLVVRDVGDTVRVLQA